MRLGLSHLAEQKFRYNFQGCLNTFCTCGLEIEIRHFLIHCVDYQCPRQIFFEKNSLIHSNNLQEIDISITKDLLFG